MQWMTGKPQNIADIIENKSVIAHFQPIVSVVKKSIVGVEGLCRGIGPENGAIIPPRVLFNQAECAGMTLELDRLCREKALRSFKGILEKNPDIFLFLNLDVSILDKAVGSKHLINAVHTLGVPPENIVIEINEAKINETGALKEFIQTYRGYGFLIALDDVGSGFSNLDRILLAEPDIIKIDRGMVAGIAEGYYKQEVFKSLVNLSKTIGALVVAEGTETLEEAVTVLQLGADMVQGYYYAEPAEVVDENLLAHALRRIESTAVRFKSYMTRKIHSERLLHKEYDNVINCILSELLRVDAADFDEKLLEMVSSYKLLECAYILDRSGAQVSDTVCCSFVEAGHKGLLFYPAEKGTDHSMKKYYYHLINAKLNKYITEPYISQATGNLCITISKRFMDANCCQFILCLDFRP